MGYRTHSRRFLTNDGGPVFWDKDMTGMPSTEVLEGKKSKEERYGGKVVTGGCETAVWEMALRTQRFPVCIS
jgi:hypothetical protein